MNIPVSCFRVVVWIGSLPNYFISEIIFSKDVVHHNFYISTHVPINVNIDTSICR